MRRAACLLPWTAVHSSHHITHLRRHWERLKQMVAATTRIWEKGWRLVRIYTISRAFTRALRPTHTTPRSSLSTTTALASRSRSRMPVRLQISKIFYKEYALREYLTSIFNHHNKLQYILFPIYSGIGSWCIVCRRTPWAPTFQWSPRYFSGGRMRTERGTEARFHWSGSSCHRRNSGRLLWGCGIRWTRTSSSQSTTSQLHACFKMEPSSVLLRYWFAEYILNLN